MKRKRGANPWLEGLGWYGMVAALLAYGLVSHDIIGPKSLAYQLLNLTAGIGLGLEAWFKRDYQPAALNAIWILIALLSIAQLARP